MLYMFFATREAGQIRLIQHLARFPIVALFVWLLLSVSALAPVSPPAYAGDYAVDRQKTLILIHVSRAGIARALGHDHLISTRQVAGTARYVDTDLARSQLELRIPVSALVVDDPDLRRAAGERYEKPVGASARDGTPLAMVG